MSVQTQIDRISTEVSAQETLLDQALAAIANKAAGGGGGGSVETCTVTVGGKAVYSAITNLFIQYVTLNSNGEIEVENETLEITLSAVNETNITVVKGSMVVVEEIGAAGMGLSNAEATNAELLSFYWAAVFKVSSANAVLYVES